MSRLHQFFTLVFLSFISAFAMANSNSAPSTEVQLKQSNTAAYLGIQLDFLPRGLVAQLPEDVLVSQGVLLSGFAKDSVADKQGLKRYDILLSYDQHALKHPQTLIDLIKRDKPGRKVELTLARKGKVLTVPVTLSSQEYPLDKDQLDYQYNLQVLGYDGVNIKLSGRKYFQVEIRYLAPDGVVRRKAFNGPYVFVQQQIYNSPDLASPAKQDLLRAIAKRKDDEDGWFGDMMPFSDGVF